MSQLGSVAVPAWVVIVAGSVLVVFIVGYFVGRHWYARARRRRREHDSMHPPSSGAPASLRPPPSRAPASLRPPPKGSRR